MDDHGPAPASLVAPLPTKAALGKPPPGGAKPPLPTGKQPVSFPVTTLNLGHILERGLTPSFTPAGTPHGAPGSAMRYGMTNRTGRGANKAIRLLLEDQLLQSFFSREGEFLASRRPSLKYPFLNGGRAEGGAPSHPWITSRRTSVVHAPAPFPTHPSHPAAHPVSADAFLPSSARRSPGFVRSLSMATPGRVPEDAAADLSKEEGEGEGGEVQFAEAGGFAEWMAEQRRQVALLRRRCPPSASSASTSGVTRE